MKNWVLFIVLFLVAFAHGETKKDRVDAIWDAAYDRIYTQADTWFDQGDFPRCCQILKFEMVLRPGDYDTATNLGYLLESTDQNDEALVWYRKFEIDNPSFPGAQLPRGNLLFKLHKYNESIAVLKPKYQKFPDQNVDRILAQDYMRQKLYKPAIEVFQFHLKHFPRDETAKRHLAYAKAQIAAKK
jgi:tetratricopeptide (TPR) repeat protein